MTTFPSSVDAANCACALQNLLVNESFMVRVGLHLGEVIELQHDVFGDGVNVASRIEALAKPGTVLVSNTFRQALTGQSEFQFKTLGTQSLKNVQAPLEVFELAWCESRAVELNFSRITRFKLRNFVFIGTVLLGLLVVLYFGKDHVSPTSTSDGGQAVRLAVIPFENMNADDSERFFVDGLSEELIYTLAMLPGVEVSSRASAFYYRGERINPVEVAESLNVEYLLMGSVRRLGDELRISAELIAPTEQKVLWSEHFRRALSPQAVFTIQEDIANQVAQTIPEVFALPDTMRLEDYGTDNMEAYDLYLQAQAEINLGDSTSRLRALELLDEALALEPDFIQAAISKAESLILLNFYGALPGEEPREEARLLLEQSESARHLASYQSARGIYAYTNGNLVQAEAFYKRALQIDPSHMRTILRLVVLLYMRGSSEEMLHFQERAVQLDPLNHVARLNYAMGLLEQGQGELARSQCEWLASRESAEFFAHQCFGSVNSMWDDDLVTALSYFRQGLSIEPNHILTLAEGALIWTELAQFDTARDWSQRIQEPGRRSVLLGGIEWLSGNKEQALNTFETGTRLSSEDLWVRTLLAEIYLEMERPESVLSELELPENLLQAEPQIKPAHYRLALALLFAYQELALEGKVDALNRALIAYEQRAPEMGIYGVRYGKAERLIIMGAVDAAFAEVQRLTESELRPLGRPGVLLSYQKPYWNAYDDNPAYLHWIETWHRFYEGNLREVQSFAPLESD